ncbi:carbohydrate ABC transporter permease [Couchioplanes caeruleus]|uniref:carbohydrate ABC transporter permease n=1 Tax=Couchioplanes caeruleus TaxID=56438 RepID=UPI0020BE8620|nr:carbohydrate ABC transporter permease [Couchioplanes caeruleus]UQU66689.1 carbohydrate ABC transporter permease [Couchioplanes caeruleus]
MTLTAPTQTPAGPVPPAPAPPRRKRPVGTTGTASRTLISAVDLQRHRTLYFLALGATLLVFTLVFLFPLYWMVTSAVKSPAEYAQSTPTFIPESWHPETYATAWTNMRIAKYFTNTVFYAVGGWLISLIVDVGVAYALSKLKPVFGRVVLGAMLASLMLPAAALLVPAYKTVVDVPLFHVNLLNTPWALWLPAAANAFNVYVLKRFFDQIPNDLLDAAAIDGAGRLRQLWSIVLPLSRPVLGVTSIFIIVAMWKDFLWPLLVLQDPESQTLSVALARLANTSQVPPTELMAGLAIASVPMIVVFLIFQRSIIGGLSAGSLKG